MQAMGRDTADEQPAGKLLSLTPEEASALSMVARHIVVLSQEDAKEQFEPVFERLSGHARGIADEIVFLRGEVEKHGKLEPGLREEETPDHPSRAAAFDLLRWGLGER